MTAQEVIKKFMSVLDNQNYSDGVSALDDAVRSSSRFDGIQDAIDNFLDAQKAAERTAIKEILGSNYKDEYADLQLEDLLKLAETDTDLKKVLSATARYDNTTNYGQNPLTFTAAERIRMKTADIFLKECGIELPHYYFRTISTDSETNTKKLMAAYYSDYKTGNVDTGAITGLDAGGSEVAKTAESIVQEIGNKYTAKGNNPQVITIGTNDWIVVGTEYADTINSGGADSIDAGEGNDVIYLEGENATVSAGANNNDADKIYVGAGVKVATVETLDEWDTLNIDGGFEVTAATLDDDDTVTVTDTNGRNLVIKNWSTAKNSTVQVGTNGQKLGAWLSDFIEYEDTSTGGTLPTGTSRRAISVDLSDVTSIGGGFILEGSTANATYNPSSTSGAVGTVSTEFPNVSSFTTNGLTVQLWGRSSSSSSSDVETLSLDDLTADEKLVFAGLYKWWIKEGLKLNEESYAMNFNEDGTTQNTLKVYFYNGDETDGTMALLGNDDSSGELALAINMTQFSGISATDENGQGKATYLDRTLAHELTHAVMRANIENFGLLPQFITEGLAELTHGIDDERDTRIWDLAAGNTSNVGTDTTVATNATSRLETALNLANTSTGTGDAYAGGYMFLRYLAKQAATQTSSLSPLSEYTVNVALNGDNATYYAKLNSKTAETATTTKSDDSFVVGIAKDHVYTPAAGIKQSITVSDSKDWQFSSIGDNVSITSGNGADTAEILGQGNNVNLVNGNNSISSTNENNTITAGSGNDSVRAEYTARNNTINLGSGNNYVSLSGAGNTITGGTGQDVILFTKVTNVEDSTTKNLINTGAGNDSLNINGANNTINAGAGNDTVIIYGSDSSIDGGAGADSLVAWAENDTINAGADNDTIGIASSNNLVNGDGGADSIVVSGTNNTVYGGADNDSIYIYASENTFYGDAGDDFFQVSASKNTITGGTGKDTIFVAKSASVTDLTLSDIDHTSDVLYFEDVIGSVDRITDGIKVTYRNSNISVNIHFENTYLPDLENLTVKYNQGGAALTKKLGDYISMQVLTGWQIESGNAIYLYEDTPVATISGLNLSGVTVDNGEIDGITVNDKTIVVSSNLVKDGVAFNTSENYVLQLGSTSGATSILGGVYNDTISFDDKVELDDDKYNVKIYGRNGDDSISLTKSDIPENSTIEASGDYGNDTISASGIKLTENGILKLSGDAGNDSISVQKGFVSKELNLEGGAGNDTITISKPTMTGGTANIDGGTNDDSISIEEFSVTDTNVDVYAGSGANSVVVKKSTLTGGKFNVNGGADNDTISIETLSSTGAKVKIDSGNGVNNIALKKATISAGSGGGGSSFTIAGGSDNDTISVETLLVADTDFEIDAGGGSNDVSLSKLNLVVSNLTVTGGTDNDTVSINDNNATNADIVVKGASGTDSISVSNLTLNGGTFQIEDSGTANDTISVEKISADNSDVVIEESGGANNITVTASTLESGNLTVTGGENDDTISVEKISVTDGDVEINANGGFNVVTVSDVTLKGDGEMNISGGTNGISTITAQNVSLNDDQTLNISTGKNSDLISVVDSKAVNITSGDGNDTLAFGKNITATISDFSASDVISLSSAVDEATYNNGVLTLGTVNLNIGNVGDIYQYANVAVINGTKTVRLGKLMGLLEWEINGTTATYGDEITITGISKSATVDDFDFDGVNTVTISGNALSKDTTVEVSNGYYLKVTDDVVLSEETDPVWRIPKSGTAEYITSFTAGYSVDGNKISYIKAGDGNVLIELTGLSSSAKAKDLTTSDTSVIVASNALSKSNIVKMPTGGDEYTLALASKVTQPTEQTAIWKISKGTANYIANAKTAGYVVENNTIVYKDATDGETTITITGLSANAKAKNLTVSGKTVLVASSALAKANTVEITSTGGYTLGLASDVAVPTVQDSDWVFSKGTANYMVGAESAGYVVENKKIVYKDATAGTSKITVTGLKTSATAKNISVDEDTNMVSLAAAAVQGSVTVTDGYWLNMGKGTYSKSTVVGGTGADTIYNSGSKLAINGNAGDDLISLASGTSANTLTGGTGDDTFYAAKGTNIYKYAAGDGDDVIYGFTEKDSLHVTSGEITNVIVKDSDVIFVVERGSVTIKDGADKKLITAEGKDKAVTQIYSEAGIYNDKQTAITLNTGFSGTYNVPTKPAVKTVDGAAAGTVQIVGSTAANSIVGGANKDTLFGGKGNDTIYGGSGDDSIFGDEGNDKLFGDAGADTIYGGAGNDTISLGAGADVYVYSGGNDVVSDYAAADDKISLASGEISSVGISGKDLTFKVGKNTLKLKNAYVGDKKVTVNDEVKIFEKGAIYNADKTSVLVYASATLDNKTLVNIDASNLSTAFKYNASVGTADNSILGGKGADSILGGEGNDSIYGNAGNDKLWGDAGNDYVDGGAGNDSIYGGAGNNTLTGGAGNDTFNYGGGNDTITDYEVGKDKIFLSTSITSAEVSGSDVILKTSTGTITVKDGADKKITTTTKINNKTTTQSQMYSTLGTYNDKQTALTLAAGVSSYTLASKITSVDGSATNGVTINGIASANLIIGGKGSDALYGGAGTDSVYGGAGADSIFGDAGNDKLYGEDGNDTISGGTGNDTFYGGDGADVFVYGGGNDVIVDFADEDKISLASGEVSSVGISGKDLTLKVGKNTIKLKDALGKKITVNDDAQIYEKGRVYNSDRTMVTITASSSATLEDNLVNIDASGLSSALNYQANGAANYILGGKGADSLKGGAGKDTIFGNAGNDKIYGELDGDYIDGGAGNDYLDGGAGNDTIYGDAGNDTILGGDSSDYIEGGDGNDSLIGDAGNDTLDGGAGNDSLYGGLGNNSLAGGAGKDVFIHEGGTDYIEDYSAEDGDTIRFKSAISGTPAVSGPNVIFKTVDGGTLTVRFGVGQEITYIDSGNKTNKQTFNANVKTLDLLYDSNFMTDDTNLDSITETKFEVQNIETQNNLELSQPAITYGEDKDK